MANLKSKIIRMVMVHRAVYLKSKVPGLHSGNGNNDVGIHFGRRLYLLIFFWTLVSIVSYLLGVRDTSSRFVPEAPCLFDDRFRVTTSHVDERSRRLEKFCPKLL